LRELPVKPHDISGRAGITAMMNGSNRQCAGAAHASRLSMPYQESFMSDATCAGRKLDHLGPPTASQMADIKLPVPRYPDGISTTNAAAAPAYTMTARILHWVMAILILSMIPLGLVIANDWGGPLQEFLYDLHRSIGALAIPLIFIRLVHRWAKPPSPLPDDIPAIQQLAARGTHWCLYALLLVQPIVGWLATSAYRAPIKVFGWFELPPIWPEDRPFSEQLFAIHDLIGTVIAGLVAAHIGGALYHHLVRKDGVLMRMITG
jgi:cytochrome b561